MRTFFAISSVVLVSILPLLAQDPQNGVPIQLFNADSSIRFAATDLATIPETERGSMRYLSLYNIAKEQRAEVGKIVSFMVNSLSTRRKYYIPVFVGGSDETVIRLNIDDYEWKSDAWEKLARNGSGPKLSPEPYFHAFIERLDTGETTKVKKEVTKTKKVQFLVNGKYVIRDEPYTETIEVDVPAGKGKNRTFAGAPWVDKEALTYLIKWTQSESPMLRADWFIANVSLPPAYYDFLRLGKNQKDFENLIFADQEKAAKARSQDKGIVVTSIVARNNRTLLRSPTFTNGYYWLSHDSKTSVDDRQYIQNILNEKFDATEDIGSLPNGLQAYFLTNGAGERIDVADPDIAIDNTAVDRLVRSGRSCMVCHSDGIRPIDDEIRSLTKKLQNKNEVKLLVVKKEDAYKIDDLFGADLDEQIVKDQNYFASAVGKVNGLKPNENSKLLGTIYDAYAEILMTPEIISRELAIPAADLGKYIKLSDDPVLLGLLRNPIRPIRRDQWERSFQGIMLIVLAQKQGFVPAKFQ